MNDMIKNGKILITGGCGFIGNAITKNLLNRGFDVKIFDLPMQFELNPPHNDVEVFKGSIMDIDAVTNAIKGCDYVIHLAALLGVKRTEEERLSCLNLNIQGTVNVLEACVRDNVKKILFSSSSEVYGDLKLSPINENTPKNPVSVYAVTKLAGEEYLKAYKQRYNLDYSVVRFFNVYGPGQVSQFVVPRFILSVLKNEQPTIYFGGSQIRCFCYVDDAVEGAVLAMLSQKANSDVFNIGNEKGYCSVIDLAKKIINLTGKDMEPIMAQPDLSDRTEYREIFERIPDISKAKSILGYNPKISLDKGLGMTIKHGKFSTDWTKPTSRDKQEILVFN